MAINYTPLTDFLTKDTLPKEDPDKVILGADFDAEFNAISTAFSGAAPTNNPTFTGTATFDGVTVNAITVGGLSLTGNATVGGTLGVTGNATFAGDVAVAGELTVAGSQVPTLEDVQDIVAGAELGPISELDNLSNVDETGKEDGDFLVWDNDAGNWVPKTEEALDLSALTTDVRTTAAIKAGTYEETLQSVPTSSSVGGFYIEDASFQGLTSQPYRTNYDSTVAISPDGLAFMAASGIQSGPMTAGYFSSPYALDWAGTSSITSTALATVAGSGDGRMAPRGLWVSDDGMTFSIIQGSSTDTNTWDRPIVYRTSVPWNITSTNLTCLSRGTSTGYQISSISCCVFSQDGLKAWVGRTNRNEVTEYRLSSGFEFNNGTGHQTITHAIAEITSGIFGIHWGDDGYTCVIQSNNDGMVRYRLTTAYDLSTATADVGGTFTKGALQNSAGLAAPACFFKDGERMLTVGGNTSGEEYDISRLVTAGTVDCGDANTFDLTLTASVDVAFINAPASGTSFALTLTVKQDATGGHAVTWPGSVVWAGGEAPTLTADANAEDVFVFMTSDGGATWYGFTSGQAFA